MKSGPRILKHFGVGRAWFSLFYLSIFIYFYLFPLVFIDFLNFLDFHVFFISLLFFRVCRKMIAPPLPKQVGFKNANRTRKLENRIVSFFFKGSSESIFPSLWSNSGRSEDEKNHIFWIFVNFANFRKPRADIFKNSMDFGVRPKDFKAFWNPAEGF